VTNSDWYKIWYQSELRVCPAMPGDAGRCRAMQGEKV